MSYRSPKTEKAARMDAEGDYDQSLILLSKAAQEGDLYARTQLGKRLLVGDRAPRMQRDGAALLLDAAQAAHAEAVAAVAILQCLGVQQRQSWQDGLNTLVHAAKLGWVPARDQLLFLTAETLEGDPQQLVDNNDGAFWDSVGKSIDLSKLFQVPKGEVLCDSPLLVSFADFLPPKLCHMFMVLSGMRLRASFNPDTTQMRNTNAEVSTYGIAQYGLMDNDFMHFLIQERMSKACGIPRTHMEGFSVLFYRPGEEFSAHVDYYDAGDLAGRREITEHGQRGLTFLIYLNDEYEGGETEFPELGIKHKGKAGEALYFVNADRNGKGDPRTRHAGLPTQSGNKWVLSQYFRDRPLPFLS
jgi:prolyl 4-hydroxylase